MRSPILRLWGMSGGLQFDEDATRDVALLGDCDDGCQELADRLGWGVSCIFKHRNADRAKNFSNGRRASTNKVVRGP